MNGLKKINRIFAMTLLLVTIMCSTVLAASVRRVPSNDLIGEGFLAIEISADGVKDLGYRGLKGKYHTYVGQIKPGDTIKLSQKAVLGSMKSLPRYKSRACMVNFEINAKKGDNLIEKKKFSEQSAEGTAEYTIPAEADNLEVFCTLEVKNKKVNGGAMNCRSRNKLVLTTEKVKPLTVATKKSSGSGGSMTGILLGIAAVGGGAFFFLKRRKSEPEAEMPAAPQQEPVVRPTVQPQRPAMSLKTAGATTAARNISWPQKNKPSVSQADTTIAATPVVSEPAATDKAKPRFCTECGAPVKPGAGFCTECGHKL